VESNGKNLNDRIESEYDSAERIAEFDAGEEELATALPQRSRNEKTVTGAAIYSPVSLARKLGFF